ncbi:cell wall protein [[Kitasatospora] papulosa]|uniref:cell wall protein n=1 Tax=Streptomyces TaxID=1883 RepID=UPI002E7A8A45|nr:cell wall protein [Streptomyces sp. JV181]MEE1776366.1 cell wall protein [Streptomyces sp. JV181]
MDSTPARHARPRPWLSAVTWLIGAGLHPRAGKTTLTVARDLAARMDYRLGFVLYDLEGTAARCGTSTATVKRHVRVLRELGALAWRRHGTKRNLQLPGRPYTATATIYAATIPAAYDRAKGHRLDVTGYGARVVGVTDEGRALMQRTVHRKPHPVDDERPGAHGRAGRAPHSPGPYPDSSVADPDGWLNYTSRTRATRARAATPRRARNACGASPRSPWQVAHDIEVARQVRPLVGWTQREGLRRLAFALRPLIDRGLAAHDIAAELLGMAVDWRPARPAAYIAAVLARDRRAETARPPEGELTADPAAHQEWQQWLRSREVVDPPRTDDDRRHARLHSWDRWREVAAHYDEDPDDALDLYGTRLCAYAVKRAAPPAW